MLAGGAMVVVFLFQGSSLHCRELFCPGDVAQPCPLIPHGPLGVHPRHEDTAAGRKAAWVRMVVKPLEKVFWGALTLPLASKSEQSSWALWALHYSLNLLGHPCALGMDLQDFSVAP